jgi:hypothetical protein
MDILRFRLEFKSIIQNTSKLYGKLYGHSKNKRPRKKPAATDTANKIHKRSKPTHKTNKLATTTTKPLSKKIEHHLSSADELTDDKSTNSTTSGDEVFDDKSTISIPDTSSDDELTDNPSNFIFTKFPPRKAHKKKQPTTTKETTNSSSDDELTDTPSDPDEYAKWKPTKRSSL